VPAEDRLGRHDARELVEELPPERVPADRAPAANALEQRNPAAVELAPEDPALLEQIVEDTLRVAVRPAGKDICHDVEDLGQGPRDGSGPQSDGGQTDRG